MSSFHCCNWCNKKYKRIEKLGEHVEKEHTFMTIGKNNHKLSLDEKLWILEEFEKYTRLMLTSCDDSDSDNLFNHISQQLNLTNEAHKLFQTRIMESGLLAKSISDTQQLFKLFDEFEMFLNLGMTWKNDNFCPSLIIDLVWHAAMMNQQKYSLLCLRFVGKVLPHCLTANDSLIAVGLGRFEQFERQFLYHHRKQCMKISDLVMGSDNAIQEVRTYLKKEQRERIERERIERERIERECIERGHIKNESEYKFNNYGGRSIWDDGKC